MGNLLGLVLVKDVVISGSEVSENGFTIRESEAGGFPMKRSKKYSILPGLETPEVTYIRGSELPVIFEMLGLPGYASWSNWIKNFTSILINVTKRTYDDDSTNL